MHEGPAILVFCHLRWDFVYQRPQHLLARLAKRRRVLFIEEPVFDEAAAPRWEFSTPEPNVLVCRPHTNVRAPGFHDEQFPAYRPLLAELLKREELTEYVAWFYTPMALPLLDELRPRAVVYDCMDELSMFRGAPPELLGREAELLKRADLVFTGGPSLYRAKKGRHPSVHCFSSSVDAAHFAQAQGDLADAPEQAGLPAPRLGFYGVIDERLDIELVDALARAKPAWQIVLVGPVVKIDPASLPRHPNVHYPGQKTYAQLPAFLKGWDVCLLPFARNDSTKFISPTKTLEYMAARRPIVSTPITDVAEPYGDIVYLADTPAAFIAACERALGEGEAERERRFAGMDAVLAKTSWDRTAEAMDRLIREACEKPAAAKPGAAGSGASAGHAGLAEANDGKKQGDGWLHPFTTRKEAAMRSSSHRDRLASNPTEVSKRSPAAEGFSDADAAGDRPVVVVGAGPTGLSAAYHLGEDALLLEKNDRVGGWCRSLEDRGFTFDMAGHIMFSNDPYVHELYQMLLGDNVHWQDREAWIYSKRVYTRYPFQGCLYGLPADVITECIAGAIEARFGPLQKKAEMKDAVAEAASKRRHAAGAPAKGSGHAASNGNGNGHAKGNGHASIQGSNGNGHASLASSHGNGHGPSQAAKSDRCLVGDVKDCCGDGVMESTAALVDKKELDAESTRGGTPADGSPAGGEPKNFEEFIYKVWGKGIAKHFAIPYNRKIWAVPLTDMETSWLGGRVPMPDLEEMIKYSLSPAAKPMGPNARFGYPLRGGFQALMDGFLPHVEDRLRLNTHVVKFSPSRHSVTLNTGEEIEYDHLVSTMPLPLLIKAAGDEVPQEVHDAVAGLKHISVRCVNIGVGRENLTDKHWIYYPEDSIFHRIFVQGNASPHCNPPGGFGFTCEITYSEEYKPLPVDGEALNQRCIEDAIKVGFIRDDDPIWCVNQVDMPYAYVVYNHARPKLVKLIGDWLAEYDVVLAGRYSQWEYYNSDHAFIAGRHAAEQVRELQKRVLVATTQNA